VSKTVFAWARELAHYTEVKTPGMVPSLLLPLTTTLKKLIEQNGVNAAVLHLKVSLFALYSFLAGTPLESTYPLGWGVRLSNGLPTCWGKELRHAVRSNNVPIIRLLASVLNIYRAMDAPHPAMATKTISNPHPNLRDNDHFKRYQDFCRNIFPHLVREQTGVTAPFEYFSSKGMLLTSAGPNVGCSSTGLGYDAAAWANEPKNLVRDWFKLHGDQVMSTLMDSHAKEFARLDNGVMASKAARNVPFNTMNQWLMANRPSKEFLANGSVPILGRLHAIPEPAGKVRVVAICDYWTQAALRPVHARLFDLLRGLRYNDATFDQDGVVKAYRDRGLKPHWSYDLKSATDLIPLALYKEALAPFLISEGETYEQGRARTELWARILTERDFFLPVDRKSTSCDDITPEVVRYTTGQPMGALSSWASMALVHHSLVQYSHWVGTGRQTWFKDYLILGDDVDIASNSAVAAAYVEVCSAFQITIGIAKSLHSLLNCFEFANRRFHPLGDLSPLSLREELASSSWATRREFAKRIVSRIGASQTPSTVLRRVLTATQWTSLLPELSGLRKSTLLSLVTYCLQNPFLSNEDMEEFDISRILKWIMLVLPEEQKLIIKHLLLDKSRVKELNTQLTKHMIATLGKEMDDRLSEDFMNELFGEPEFPAERVASAMKAQAITGEPPTSWAEYYLRTYRHKWIPLLEEDTVANVTTFPAEYETICDHMGTHVERQVIRGLLPDPHIRGEHVGPSEYWTLADVACPLTPTHWDYLQFCINDTNIRQRQLVSQLSDKLAFLQDGPEVKVQPDGSVSITETVPPLGKVLNIWKEFHTDCNFIPRADLSKSFDYRLNLHETQKVVDSPKMWSMRDVVRVQEEACFGPMKELHSFIAGYLGITIPNIPFFNQGPKGKHWVRSLRAAVRKYELSAPKLRELSIAWDLSSAFDRNPRKLLWDRLLGKAEEPVDGGLNPSIGPPPEPTSLVPDPDYVPGESFLDYWLV